MQFYIGSGENTINVNENLGLYLITFPSMAYNFALFGVTMSKVYFIYMTHPSLEERVTFVSRGNIKVSNTTGYTIIEICHH